MPRAERFEIRRDLLKVNRNLKALVDNDDLRLSETDKGVIKASLKSLEKSTDYAPIGVIALISISLGLGTMIGWKRIVVTIGEKIGKRHMTFAEGATAEIIAASTIALSTQFGLPVSTTHVLSSGVAGAMVASKGTKNLQRGTIANIALAWVLTLPATIILSGGLYMLFRMFA